MLTNVNSVSTEPICKASLVFLMTMQNKTRNILLMSAISILAAAAIPHADAAIYMKIGDIEGESTDDKHIGWIELDSFKCGVDNTTKKKIR